MARKRSPQAGTLPERWEYKHGAYYYRPRESEKAAFDKKSWFRLGATYPEALRAFADRKELEMGEKFAHCIDRYMLEVLPTLAASTQPGYRGALERLRKVMGDSPVRLITPQDAYQYMDAVAKAKTMNIANLDIRVLKAVIKRAVRWGICPSDPLKGNVQEFGARDGVRKVRERYVEDWELVEWRKVASPQQQAFAAMVLLLGTRKTDILRLTRADIDEGHGLLHVFNSKSDKVQSFVITPALRAALDMAIACQSRSSLLLFPNRYGQTYVNEQGRPPAFDAAWLRYMNKAIAETDLKEPFTRHDLRAKRGSDEEDERRAQELLGHSNISMTRKHYRRKISPIMPAK